MTPTQPACPLDGTPIHDHATICTPCTADLEQALAELPALIDDLEITLSRQTAAGTRNGGRSTDKPLPYDATAGDALRDLHALLTSWVRTIHTDPDPCHVDYCPATDQTVCDNHGGRDACGCTSTTDHQPADIEHHDTDGWPHDDTPAMARWLLTRLDRARRHEAGPDLKTDILNHVRAARRATDRVPAEKVYAGLCGATNVGPHPECPQPLYARPDATTTLCAACGTPHDVTQRRQHMRDTLTDMLLPAAEAADAVTGLWGEGQGALDDNGHPTWHRVTTDTIRGMARSNHIYPHAHDTRDGRNTALYRVGDVIAVLNDRHQRKTRRSPAA